MACACDGKVSGSYNKKCAWCNEAIKMGLSVSSHSCQWGKCS